MTVNRIVATVMAILFVGVTAPSAMSGSGLRAELPISAEIRTQVHQLETHPDHPIILYNIGTLYLQDNRLGEAVWFLERARHRSPRDPDIRKNLDAARHQVNRGGDYPSIGQDLMETLRLFSVGEVLVAWLLVTLILGITTMAWMYDKLGSRRLKLAVMIWVGMSIPTGLLVWDSVCPRAIVIRATMLRVSPSSQSPAIMPIAEGIQLNMGTSFNRWTKVTLNSGTIGWVKIDDIRSL